MFGTWKNGSSYSAIDIMAVPCGYQYTAFDGTVQEINDDNCNWDKDALGDYLGGNAIFNVFAN